MLSFRGRVAALCAVIAACGGPDLLVIETGPYPNEPNGAIVLIDYDADFGNPSDPPWSYVAGAGNLSTVSDVTAPVNPSTVGRVRFTAGCCDGSGPAQLSTAGRGTPPSGWSRWYVSDWLKIDANWTPHACCQKIFEFFWTAGGDNWLRVMTNWGYPLTPQFVWSPAGGATVNLGGRPLLQPGVWYQFEIVIHRTGRAQFWVRRQNGQPESMYDGPLPGFTDPSAGTEDVFWWWGYGGTGAYPGPTAYINHNHMRSSYTP